MFGVILGGGSGTRLRPYLANGLNKHLTPIYDRPMIHHVIRTLVSSGITDIIIVLNGKNPGSILECVGDGSDFGARIYFIYDTNPIGKGPAFNILQVEALAGAEHILLIAGDSIYFHPLPLPDLLIDRAYIWSMYCDEEWDDREKYARVWTNHSTGFVTKLSRGRDGPNNLIQTGAWVFPSDVYDRIHSQANTLSTGQELRITDIAHSYVTDGKMVALQISNREFIDCGTPDAIRTAEKRFAEQST